MTTLPIAPTVIRHQRQLAATLLGLGTLMGAVGALVEAVVGGFWTTSPDTGAYQYSADYWFTASALPAAAGVMLLLVALQFLQGSGNGRLRLAGMMLAAICLLALAMVIIASLAAGHDVQAGPTYVLGTFGATVAIALYAAGSWRAGLLPKWLLAIWPILWMTGSFFALGPSPIVLAAFYVVLLLTARRRGLMTEPH